MNKINIAILASGNGSNAENIVNHFVDNEHIAVTLIASNIKRAYVLQRASKLGVASRVFTKSELENPHFLSIVDPEKFDIVVLAGFLLKIPAFLISAFPDRIINIHPALLPKFGGKGMYGDHVHLAVIRQGETVSGITIHLVNEVYDSGRILFQTSCPVLSGDQPATLATRIHQLEHKYFPQIIEDYINKL